MDAAWCRLGVVVDTPDGLPQPLSTTQISQSGMSLVSFPRTELDENDREPTLYDKVFNAASSVFASLRPDEDAAPNLQSLASSTHSRSHSRRSLSIAPSNHTSVGTGAFQVSSPTQSLKSPVPPVPQPIASTSTPEPEVTLAPPNRESLILDISSLNADSARSTMQFKNSPQPSVSVSSEHAVPLLPTSVNEPVASPVAPLPSSSPFEPSQRQHSVDVESLFSVNSKSASREYLASQYSRGRSRAQPSRLSREYWMKDDSATSCFSCNRRFTTFRRKHHCRVCGQIFCSACTTLVDGERCGSNGRRVRCCKACEDALALHSSSDDEVDASFVSQAPQDVDISSVHTPPPSMHHYQATPTQQQNLLPPLSPYTPFPSLGEYPQGSADDPTESYSMFTSPAPLDDTHLARSFLGSQHVVRNRSRSHTLRDDPVVGSVGSIGSTLNDNMSSVGYGSISTGNSLAVPVANGLASTGSASGSGNNVSHVIPSAPLALARFPNSATVELNNASRTYLLLFLEQLLRDSELDPDEWKPVLTTPLLEVAAGLHLELNDKLSPREWVKIKRIPGGTPQDIGCICGSVFTHSLARRSMAIRIKSPRILLITFPLEYARMERYMSLDPVAAQEKEYLRKLIARIAALKPTMLLSCSHVCGKAMDMLEAQGIAVAQNVRESAMFRLSRITRADILTSIDRLSTSPKLGTCELFEQRSYQFGNRAKTFLFFFVRPGDPGRCALVRGNPEISAVIKVVLEVMAEICYSLKAETALMRDQLVNVPNITDPKPLILSSSPFVNYGTPFLQSELHMLEDRVVQLSDDKDTSPAVSTEDTVENETASPDNANAEDKKAKYIRESQLEVARTKWLAVERLWETTEASYPFMFNPSSHQNIMVLYSLVCDDTATPCVGPDPQLIEFYLNTDQTLGRFVETTISLIEDPCPDGCDHKLISHSRKYINGNGMVTASVEPMPCKVLGLEDSILMWSYCKSCDQHMPIAPMSSTTWKYSMGKYLELSLYGEPLKMRASTCSHNIYRDHIRYFGWHGYALKIEYSSIELHEIVGPPTKLRYDPVLEVNMKQQAFEFWQSRLDRFWQSLLESLMEVKVEGLEQDMIDLSKQRLVELRTKAELDWKTCNEKLHKLNAESDPNDYLSLNNILEFYQQLVDKWHSDIGDFDGQFFPTERDIRRVTAQHLRGLLGEDTEKQKQPQPAQVPIELPDAIASESPTSSPSQPASTASSPSSLDKGDQELDHNSNSLTTRSDPTPAKPSDTGASALVPDVAHMEAAGEPSSRRSSSSTFSEAPSPSVNVKSRFGNKISLSMPGLAQAPEGAGRVAILAKHFEELSREFERERQREKQRLKDRQRAIQMRHAYPVAEVFEDLSDAVEDWPQQSRNSTATPQSTQAPTSTSGESTNSPILPTQQHEPSSNEPPAGANSINDDNITPVGEHLNPWDGDKLNSIESNTSSEDPGPEATPSKWASREETREETKEDDENRKVAEPAKISLISTLANFWSERSSTRWNGIEYMLNTTEHYFSNSNVVLRESEPSSLIAFCLSLPDYQSRINEFYESTPGVPPINTFDGDDNAILEQAMLRQTGTHMRYYFDRSSIKASCKIFFSEQFDALRRKCMSTDSYIQSLSRCSTWDSLGGKSGSAFLKTRDDRLILKELSHAEFDSFITFAPSYFEYMTQALFHDLPTILARLFGVYQIIIRNSQKSQPVKMYVLVMENLFYGGRFGKFFDLKGSMRNRKVTETGKANEVLLDENMVEYIYETPVFVREHCKRMLRASLYNDTLFLTKMNVMDYSLVIGLDEENNTIVAGIIDYIRTYTWDKKIESWVKARAATSHVKEPTVVSPKQYKGRFRESMDRYFVMVPDCWSQPSI